MTWFDVLPFSLVQNTHTLHCHSFNVWMSVSAVAAAPVSGSVVGQ